MDLSEFETRNLKNKAKELHRKMFTSRNHEESIAFIEASLTSIYIEARAIGRKESPAAG